MRLIYHPWEKNLLLLHTCRPMAAKGLVYRKIIFLHMKHTMKMLFFLFSDDNVYTIVQFLKEVEQVHLKRLHLRR